MDMSTVTGAYTGLKFAKDVFQVLLRSKVALETRAEIDTAMEKLGAAQHTMFEMRDELSRLQHQNDNLREQLKARDDWEAQKAKYRLVREDARWRGGLSVSRAADTPCLPRLLQRQACHSDSPGSLEWWCIEVSRMRK